MKPIICQILIEDIPKRRPKFPDGIIVNPERDVNTLMKQVASITFVVGVIVMSLIGISMIVASFIIEAYK